MLIIIMLGETRLSTLDFAIKPVNSYLILKKFISKFCKIKIITMKKLIIVLLSVIFYYSLPGCVFKKDVMKDTADKVEEVVIVESGGSKFLVTKETIFQATSKSQKGGFRTTSGYQEYRLTSYDINTGAIVKRIELGEADDNYHYFLGPADGLLWYFSKDEKTGLHARDPKTLDIKITKDDILNANPDLKNNLPNPKYYDLSKYYGFDLKKKMPMISDNNGFIYYIDPKTLKAEKTSKSIERFRFEETTTSTSLDFDKDNHLSLSGSPRNHLRVYSKELNEPTFLNGNFLFSSNKENIWDANPEYYIPLIKRKEKKQHEYDSLKQLLDDGEGNSKMQEWQQNNIKLYMGIAKDELDRINKEMEEDVFGSFGNGLISKDRGVFVLHQSNASDTCKVIISKVVIYGDTTVQVKWNTYIPDIFMTPDKVLDKPGFEYVFSKGSPDFRIMRATMSVNRLVFIFMLRAVCIDTDTGQILWDIEL